MSLVVKWREAVRSVRGTDCNLQGAIKGMLLHCCNMKDSILGITHPHIWIYMDAINFLNLNTYTSNLPRKTCLGFCLYAHPPL
jgi:hypothetical protein